MSRLGAGRHVELAALPSEVTTSVVQLTTFDEAKVSGVLYALPGARSVVTLMHPRQDVTHHPLVPLLLQRGYAVWTQGSRSPNNDLGLLHEQALLDVAAGMVFLRERFEHLVTLGHSGGGTLYAFYIEQASLAPAERVARTPGGRPVPLADALMPVPDRAVFLAPHPGQGELLLHSIDPSVTDEDDPLSVDSALDLYAAANGFRPAPQSSQFDPAFLAKYRAAQRARVARIDEVARASIAMASDARKRFKATGDAQDRRRELAPSILRVFRTDADPRCVDLSLDASERPYGSVFGSRPDLINYGLVGFGRLATAEAWLSTWSGLSTRAQFERCARGVSIPTLFLSLTGDQAAFPSTTRAMFDALASVDKTLTPVRGTHFGGPIAPGATPGSELASEAIASWIAARGAP